MKTGEQGISPLYVLLYVLLILISAGLIIYISYAHGKLALPPVYDDVSYYADALERLTLLRDRGLGALLNDIYTRGIHSYHSELLSFFSYIIIGPYVIAPNILASLFLLFISWVLMRATFGKINTTTFLALLLFLSLPLSSNILLEIRPDLIAYCCLALGLYLYTHKDQSYLPGVLIAYALIAKFTVAPLVFVLSVIAFLMRLASGGKGFKRNVIGALTSSRKTIYIVVLISLPLYLLNYEHFNQYFYTVVFGEQKEIWAAQQGLNTQLLFMLNGKAAQFTLGKAYLLLYPVILLQLVFLWLKDRRQFYSKAPYGLLVLCAYIILTTASVRTVYLDAIVPIMVIVLFFDVIAYWANNTSRFSPLWIILILGILFNIANYKQEKYDRYTPQEISFIDQSVADLSTIAKTTGIKQKVFMPVSAQLNRDVLAVEYSLGALKNKLPTFKFGGTAYTGDMDWQITQIRKSNYIIYPDKRYFEKRIRSKPPIPGHTDISISTINYELHNSNHYQIVKRYDQGNQAEIVLYRNLQLD